jgi:hypothetical protein
LRALNIIQRPLPRSGDALAGLSPTVKVMVMRIRLSIHRHAIARKGGNMLNNP